MSQSINCSLNLPLRSVDWRSAYDEVLQEVDVCKLVKLIEIAEPAIRTYRDVLLFERHDQAELQATEDALNMLRLLKRTRLSFDSI